MINIFKNYDIAQIGLAKLLLKNISVCSIGLEQLKFVQWTDSDSVHIIIL